MGELHQHTEVIASLDFSAGEDMLLSVGHDRNAYVWREDQFSVGCPEEYFKGRPKVDEKGQYIGNGQKEALSGYSNTALQTLTRGRMSPSLIEIRC